MKIHLIYDENECHLDVNELAVANAVIDICKGFDVDIKVVGYLLQVQGTLDDMKHDRKMNECSQMNCIKV